ncbi:MAG: electron transfer flavoprotein subunit beta/FixA family protein [Bacteroidetes bacterium]|nr:electron transfer flavoprotein subunit beta/FixA family protein [Bacteroidota bacterium]
MNIIVCIAKVPDTTTKIVFSPDGRQLATPNIQWVINPLDEFALTRALEIKEAKSGKVIIVSVGKADCDPLIRKAFAMGADEGIRVDAEPADPYFTSVQLAHYIRTVPFDMIFMGRETSDFAGAQVPGMVAELLGLPFISGVPKFDFDGTLATMEREIEGGKETVKVKPPFVVSAQEGITEPRIPTMRGIMTARTKPLKVVPAVTGEILTEASNYELPPQKGECKMVDAETPEKLIELLHTEAKII